MKKKKNQWQKNPFIHKSKRLAEKALMMMIAATFWYRCEKEQRERTIFITVCWQLY